MFIGKPPGNTDRILDFSTALTGNLFFVPTADFLDNPPGPGATTTQGDAPATEDAPPPAAINAEGSLGIGSLKGASR